MNFVEKYKLLGFYEHELKNSILPYWLPRCEDRQFGGFINCYSNDGRQLASYDKYTWSQGRFVWVFSRLAGTEAPVFSAEERREFLRLAKNGVDFLMKYALIGANDWRCSFLMERDGTHKVVSPGAPLDMSIYADCFVVLGLGMYSAVSGEKEPYTFAKKLYESIVDRVRSGRFNTLPYPLSPCYRAHGIPMILDNTARELLRAAEVLDKDYVNRLKQDMISYAEDILFHFTDAENAVHEIITEDNRFFPQILGQHMNPGHTIEDVWFLLDASELTDNPEWKKKIFEIAKKAFETGWDEEYGGLLHFCGMEGGEPLGDDSGVENETMTKQLSGWGDKLWWPHSEALYTSLRCCFDSGNEEFLKWHDKVFDYTFRTFPQRDPEIREWQQIRLRDGSPQDKVVALPVKDPFHISRDLILIIELLYKSIWG